MRKPPSKQHKAQVGRRFLDAFRAADAVEVTPDILLPAETLLDLYGEDIRARAYVTTDPLRGEMMLRPDFTVPVAQVHMESGAEPARYCYLGEVFRKQDHADTLPAHPRDSEYLQAGFEMFSREAGADAEVFALFHRLLAPYGLRAVIGDMRILLDAVDNLSASAARRVALRHHIWRPQRFARLMARFCAPPRRRRFPDPAANWSGLRSKAEMAARIARLQADADEPALPRAEAEALARLFAIQGPAPQALTDLRALRDALPAIAPAVAALAARLDTIAGAGIALQDLYFDASHGRQSMEYYDGMTFSFFAPGRTDWPPVAQGGRYDALTAVLGEGRAIPAVGGIIRPGLIAELECALDRGGRP